MSTSDVIILGAGAAGLMCAIEAGKRGRRVLVLERTEKIGKKILISGGGRCNFTNLHCTPQNFLSDNPHFAKSALARYTPADFIALVEKHGIAYHEKTLGQLFCDGSAQQIVEMLEAECRAAGVRILTNVQIKSVARVGDGFEVRTAREMFAAKSLVVATGGMSIPKMGATGFGYEVAKQFGLKIVTPRPALVPLTFAEDDLRQFAELSGVSVEVVASVAGKKTPQFREKMLFTHRGLSGPAILQIASYVKQDANGEVVEKVALDLAPGVEVMAEMKASPAGRDMNAAKAALHRALPNRLAERWLQLNAPKDFTNRSLEELERKLHHWEVAPWGTEGYAKAEVTAGGVDTDELNAKTMEAKKVPGLYFIGEVVDVTGWLGGFNFQWAWASGFSAGNAV